jgi:hypothetical protein
MLDVQRKNNPDIKQTLNEDVRHTSLRDKHIDLMLMIDVLEHVPNPEEARRGFTFSYPESTARGQSAPPDLELDSPGRTKAEER